MLLTTAQLQQHTAVSFVTLFHPRSPSRQHRKCSGCDSFRNTPAAALHMLLCFLPLHRRKCCVRSGLNNKDGVRHSVIKLCMSPRSGANDLHERQSDQNSMTVVTVLSKALTVEFRSCKRHCQERAGISLQQANLNSMIQDVTGTSSSHFTRSHKWEGLNSSQVAEHIDTQWAKAVANLTRRLIVCHSVHTHTP